MKQKLALARVLLHRPPLVLLDEPTAGLDVVAAAAIREDLEMLVEGQGVTVFLTTPVPLREVLTVTEPSKKKSNGKKKTHTQLFPKN